MSCDFDGSVLLTPAEKCMERHGSGSARTKRSAAAGGPLPDQITTKQVASAAEVAEAMGEEERLDLMKRGTKEMADDDHALLSAPEGSDMEKVVRAILAKYHSRGTHGREEFVDSIVEPMVAHCVLADFKMFCLADKAAEIEFMSRPWKYAELEPPAKLPHGSPRGGA